MLTGRKSAGHPVDVAFGTLYSTHEDISIPGKVALTWERRYSTALLDQPPTPLGKGWTTRYFSTLTRVGDEYRLVSPEGDIESFIDSDTTIEKGGVVRNLGTFQELAKIAGRYVVTRWDVESGEIECFVFKEGRKGGTWPLSAIEDITGQGLDLLRDDQGRLTAVRQRLEQRTLRIDYTEDDRIKAVCFVSPEGEEQILARYMYGDGRLTAAYDALNNEDMYIYDRSGRMVREHSKGGGVYDFQYDDKGRCIYTAGIDGYDEKRFNYLDHIGWTEVTNSLGHVTRYQWLPSGQVVLEMDPLGAQKKTTYDGHGRMISREDANLHTTTFEYDEQGNRRKIIDALGQTTELAYNAAHQLTSHTNPAGHSWHRIYAANRLVATLDPEGNRYRLNYDTQGNLSEIIDPNDNRFRLHFSDKGELQSFSDWLGHTTHHQRDSFDRLLQIADALGNRTDYHYDANGRIAGIDYPDNTSSKYVYDASGNLTRLIDRDGQISHFRYGACNRLIESIDPLGNKTQFSWSKEPDQLHRITNAKGEFYIFEYDQAGRVVVETGFDGRKTTFEYDQAGNRIAMVNGLEERVIYEHNALGQLTGQQLPDGSRSTFAYDENGLLIQAENKLDRISFDRDLLGRIKREVYHDHTLERKFDAVGNQIQFISSLGLLVDYNFDANGWLTLLKVSGEKQTIIKRDALGSEINRIMPGHFELNQHYDSLGRLVRQSVIPKSFNGNRLRFDTPKTLIHRTYTYNKAQLSGIKDLKWGNTTYVCDPCERLTQVLREKGASEFFRYDETDNISFFQQKGKSVSLDYTRGNRLIKKGNIEFDYDAQGRLIRKKKSQPNGVIREWRYTWDALDQLISVTTPKGVVWQYFYDPFGRRILKSSSTGETIGFIWNQDVVLHQTDKGIVSSSWVFDPHSYSPLCKIEDGNLFSIITDHLGTPKEIIDPFGRIVWQADHYAWGAIRKTHSTDIECPIRFQGQWFDPESGLHYNRYRYYDPENGIFICQDPIGLIGGLNAYQYAPNPLGWIDPLGLNKTSWSLFDSDGNVIASGKMTPDPKAKSIPGRTGDSEQKILSKITREHGSRLEGSTLVIESEPTFIKTKSGKVVPIKGIKPCDACDERMNEFSKKNKMKIKYKYREETKEYPECS